MKTLTKYLFCVVGGLVWPAVLAGAGQKAASSVTLEVMNPRADIARPPFFPITARVPELAGKRIGIYWIGKAGGDNFFDGVEQLLNEKYPTAKIFRYKGPFDLGEKRAAEIAKEVDTIIYGVGD